MRKRIHVVPQSLGWQEEDKKTRNKRKKIPKMAIFVVVDYLEDKTSPGGHTCECALHPFCFVLFWRSDRQDAEQLSNTISLTPGLQVQFLCVCVCSRSWITWSTVAHLLLRYFCFFFEENSVIVQQYLITDGEISTSSNPHADAVNKTSEEIINSLFGASYNLHPLPPMFLFFRNRRGGGPVLLFFYLFWRRGGLLRSTVDMQKVRE